MHFLTNLTHRGFLMTVCDISNPAHPLRLPHRRRQIAQADPRRQTSDHEQWIKSLLRRSRALCWAKQCQRLFNPPVRQPRAFHGAS